MQIKYLYLKGLIQNSGDHNYLINNCDEYKSLYKNNLNNFYDSFYRILTAILYPIFVIVIYLRKIFKKEDSIRYREKFFLNILMLKEKVRKN